MAVSESTAQRYQLQDPDVRLMLQVRDGDAAAFEELMLRYQNRLLNVISNLVPQRELAEDLVQDVFLRVYRARKTYEPGAKFSTWLFTIANNVASNARRSQARRKETHVESRDHGEGSGLEQLAQEKSGLLPARTADQLERAEMVRRAMEQLSERQRMGLLLAKFEEMSYAEIGEAMGLSIPAVKSLLSRARANLREFLEPYMREGALPSPPES